MVMMSAKMAASWAPVQPSSDRGSADTRSDRRHPARSISPQNRAPPPRAPVLPRNLVQHNRHAPGSTGGCNRQPGRQEYVSRREAQYLPGLVRYRHRQPDRRNDTHGRRRSQRLRHHRQKSPHRAADRRLIALPVMDSTQELRRSGRRAPSGWRPLRIRQAGSTRGSAPPSRVASIFSLSSCRSTAKIEENRAWRRYRAFTCCK